MMAPELNILFLSRASLFTVRGGDTVQVTKTAEALQRKGLNVDVRLCNDKTIDYANYDLIHFFNIRHPADMLVHIKKSRLPYVLSTIYVDYNKPEARKASGFKDRVLNVFTRDGQEYVKTVGKHLFNGEKIMSADYLWKGHRRSVMQILSHASWLLPNSKNEYQRLLQSYNIEKKYSVVPNGADTGLFSFDHTSVKKEDNMVLCVARFEVLKNQINLIRALNDSKYELYLVGDSGPNHRKYFDECKKAASSNIHFIPSVPQETLVGYYQRARVHVLPSWFETTGLASLEALFCGCNIVVTQYGDTKDYFDPLHCQYCDPASAQSIFDAVERSSAREADLEYINNLKLKYNWDKAAEETWQAYQQVMKNQNL